MKRSGLNRLIPDFFRRRPLIGVGLITLSVMIGLTFGWVFTLYAKLPDEARLERYRPDVVSRIYDRDGQLLARLYRENRVWLPYRAFPPHLVAALLALEDDRFFEHDGIRFESIARAALVDIREMRIAQGGSTITQQLAKSLYLSPAKTLTRKINEALLAIEIENRYTKEKILEIYMNQIYLGGGAYGFESAAQHYFGKSARELNLNEAATLAAIPKGPSIYAPDKDMSAATRRRNLALDRMAEVGAIDSATASKVKAKPITLAPEELAAKRIGAYFIEMVRQDVDRAYGSDALYRAGFEIVTTLDAPTQEIVERTLERSIESIRAQLIKDGIVKPDEPGPEMAAVALDLRDGSIVALSGGLDFSDSQFNRITMARRAPGSSFKPLIYLLALENGSSAATTIIDAPLDFPMGAARRWRPQNYSKKFYGRVTLREALRLSLNVSSVKLLESIGIDRAIKFARRFRIDSKLDPNLTLALGASAVTPLELTAAYAAIANGGVYLKPTFIKSIRSSSGAILRESEPDRAVVASEEASYILTTILEDVIKSGTGQRAKIAGPYLAGKTGTTDNFRDSWFIGYDTEIALGVWIGFDDNRPMSRSMAGGLAAAPVWGEMMRDIRAARARPPEPFPEPAGITFRMIDQASGLLVDYNCYQGATLERFVKGTEPKRYCSSESDLDRAQL